MADGIESSKAVTPWTFLNSSFGLWLFSAIFITGAGSAYTAYQAQNTESRKTKEYVERLDLEISYRYSQFLNGLYEISEKENGDRDRRRLKEGKTASDVRKVYEGLREPSSVSLGFLYPEFRPLGLKALEAELRRFMTGSEQYSVDRSLSKIAVGVVFENTNFSDVNEVARAVLYSMSDRWRITSFAFVDCPQMAPFC